MQFYKQPWPHQLEIIELAKDLPKFGLFWEPGVGKTGATINLIRHRFNSEKRFLRTLVFCPPIVIKNWKDEFQMHSRINPDQIHLLYGEGKQRLKLLTKEGFTSNKSPEPAVFITNYESLLMPDLYELLQSWGPEILVVDESHKCKDSKAKRSKALSRLANGQKNYPIPYRYILTGTPILNNPMDLFSQFLILDGGDTFGTNFFVFRARYFYDKNAGMPSQRHFPDWRIKPGSLEEIGKRISKNSSRKEKKDCLYLPPLVNTVLKVGMTDKQAKLYKEMATELITYIESQGQLSPVIANIALTKALRLMQIASGYVKTEDGREITLLDTPKQAALKELLETLTPDSKVIVWAVFKENYEQIRTICYGLGIRSTEIHGGISNKQKFENVGLFNDDPTVRVLIGHPGAGGIGINLVVAPYSIFYSRNFSLEQSLQAEARNYRGGSEIHSKITRYDLVCENSIEEEAQKILAQKKEIGDIVLCNSLISGLKNRE